MATKARVQKLGGAASRPREQDDPESVTAYLNALDHPLKSVIESIRVTILESDRTITEGIKWNSPSFYCYGWFATVNIRGKSGVQVVLHHGAKVHADSTLSLTIEDSSQLLKWLSKDRAIVTFVSPEAFQSKRGVFKKIIKQWAEYQTLLAGSLALRSELPG